MALANLALDALGIFAAGRRDGFREATVVAVAILGVGATVVHVMDIVETGNMAPGNTLQNVSNLLKPIFLIGFLAAIRAAERSPASEARTPAFGAWRGPRIRAAGLMTASVAAGFGIGFGAGLPVTFTLLGILAGAILAIWAISRATAPNDAPHA